MQGSPMTLGTAENRVRTVRSHFYPGEQTVEKANRSPEVRGDCKTLGFS